MLTVAESICCREIEQVKCTMELEGLGTCITDHPGFRSVCLDIWTLRIAYLAYKQQYGDLQEDENRYKNN